MGLAILGIEPSKCRLSLRQNGRADFVGYEQFGPCEFSKVRGAGVSGFRDFAAPGATTKVGDIADLVHSIFWCGDLGVNSPSCRAKRGDKFYLVTRCAEPAVHTERLKTKGKDMQIESATKRAS